VHALLLTALIGGAIAVVLLVTTIRDRRDPMPYAPCIALGAIVVFLLEGTAFAAV
jgi:prepilin signal peptidase PulO-like enzyme (type II secretory pathway)